jgi:hypothetical protein
MSFIKLLIVGQRSYRPRLKGSLEADEIPRGDMDDPGARAVEADSSIENMKTTNAEPVSAPMGFKADAWSDRSISRTRGRRLFVALLEVPRSPGARCHTRSYDSDWRP